MKHLFALLAVVAFMLLVPAVLAQEFRELKVIVMQPDGGELWWGYQTIRWLGACDPPDNVHYRIEISVDGGST